MCPPLKTLHSPSLLLGQTPNPGAQETLHGLALLTTASQKCQLPHSKSVPAAPSLGSHLWPMIILQVLEVP